MPVLAFQYASNLGPGKVHLVCTLPALHKGGSGHTQGRKGGWVQWTLALWPQCLSQDKPLFTPIATIPRAIPHPHICHLFAEMRPRPYEPYGSAMIVYLTMEEVQPLWIHCKDGSTCRLHWSGSRALAHHLPVHCLLLIEMYNVRLLSRHL